MSETKLITLQDIAELKPLSLNMDVVKSLDPFILEAQEFDVRPEIGDNLYLELLADAPTFSTPKLDKLFNGCDYVYGNENFKHEGVKSSLIYFTYARYLLHSNANATPFGMRVKSHNYSEPIDGQTLSRIVKQTQSGAIAYQNRYKLFMSRFSNDYGSVCGTDKANKTSTKIRSVGK